MSSIECPMNTATTNDAHDAVSFDMQGQTNHWDIALALVPWISVNERMPEPDQWVLAHNGKWTGLGRYVRDEDGYYEASERWQDEHTVCIEHCGPKVTHWMPLPPPPAKER